MQNLNGNVRAKHLLPLAEALDRARKGEDANILIWETLRNALSPQEQRVFNVVRDSVPTASSKDVAYRLKLPEEQTSVILNRIWQLGLMRRHECATEGARSHFEYEVNWTCKPERKEGNV